ncbi:MAG: carbohydrate binding family 9 domain-containing protein [Bryobacteraceae bacterium]|nr:carbohydrate binding family 9 domain-containing protein [Bryobacteraceae bacterium]
MARAHILAALALFPLACGAQPAETPALTVPRVSRPPKLADFLTGEPREAELIVTDFRQMDPGDGDPVSRPTTAFLSYDDRNLYVAFIAKDDPKLIRSRVAKRKQILTDDRVTINIDTFHDHRHAYWFDVNAHAIQFDGVTTDGYGDDFSWEGLWYAEAKIVDDGYVVLIVVPFRTLRFPDTPKQQWGVMLGRFISRNNEFSMWPYITRRKLPQFVTQFGHLNGLENISPGRNVQFIPYGLFSASRYLDRPAEVTPRMVTEKDFRGGIDGKLVIKDALTLDMTLNPDFSQVESDEPQVTVNQRFEVFFPERRPFFIENASYFSTPQNLFFSRRIADPEFGGRLTGRLGRWGIGVLAADDRAAGRLVPSTDPRFGTRAKDAVLSLQRDFSTDSHVRLFATDRELGPGYNRVASLDARLHLQRDFFFTGQAVASLTRAGAGSRDSGESYYAHLARTARDVQYYSSYTDRSPAFRADLGFIPRTDMREFKNRLGYKWWPEKSALVNFGPAVIVSRNWNYSGQTQDWEAALEWSMELTRLTRFTYSRGELFELYRGLPFRKSASYYIFGTEWFKWLAVQGTFSHGGAINYYPAAGHAPFLGNFRDVSLDVTLRPTARLRLDERYIHSRLATRGHFPAAPAGAPIFNNHIVRSKANYQFTRELSLRAIVDYNAVLPNASLVSLERAKRIGYDLLLTYLLHPGTAVYAGYTDIYENLLFNPARPPYLALGCPPSLNTGRQLFLKVSYLFRF